MSSEKNTSEKARLHPRNRNRERYDLKALVLAIPALKNYVARNDYGTESINFSNPKAVKLLNQALLKHYYGIQHWDFPDQNLCPPIPGRADYLHYLADLLGEDNFGQPPTGASITCLDVGVGASCIYPVLGVTAYGWHFIGSDVDAKSIKSAQHIVSANPATKGKIQCILQKNPRDIFQNIIGKEDKLDLTICNPPFHASKEEALAGAQRKVQNLSGKKVKKPELNFAGISNELIYDGGEYRFIERMIRDSQKFSKNCYWFSTLVSKQSNVAGIQKLLEKTAAVQIKKIPMGTGNKASRIIAWTFLSADERREWRAERWNSAS